MMLLGLVMRRKRVRRTSTRLRWNGSERSTSKLPPSPVREAAEAMVAEAEVSEALTATAAKTEAAGRGGEDPGQGPEVCGGDDNIAVPFAALPCAAVLWLA